MIDNKNVSTTSGQWERINMRNVAHLIGVEFIHDLYNRHEPKINSIRFRHTVTIWKDGIVNSYAPAHEWRRLEELLGHQYYRLDPLIINQTKLLYRRRREHFHAFIKTLHATNFTKLSDADLFSVLTNFQSLVLGELYVLNFVQVEYALNKTIKKILHELVPNEQKVEEIFMRLIQTETPTESQREKQALYKIAGKWRLRKKISLYDERRARKDVESHFEKYQYLYSAYGETPKHFDSFWTTFEEYLSQKTPPPIQKNTSRLLTRESRKTLRELKDTRLDTLIPLLVTGGIFRDTNKALLGQSMRYRFAILNEIARRGLETRGALDFYLLAEIADLLRQGKRLDPQEVLARKEKGVVFTRFEDFQVYDKNILPIVPPSNTSRMLQGQCASRGSCTGECKIVLTKKDAHKVKPGDIMVAIGTDFDLIEAMYRSAAVITEEGGILSHASVVCREINKPCCMSVKQATKILKDGQRVRVEATRGEIFLL